MTHSPSQPRASRSRTGDRAIAIGLLAFALAGIGAAPGLDAAAAVVRRSPRETVTLALGGATISVAYGRPALGGRVAFGELLPWGDVWRAGDDEATVFATDAPLRLGTLAVPAGRYALFVRPGEDRFTLLLNRDPDQWGGWNRDPARDLGETPMRVSRTETPIERVSIVLEATGEESGRPAARLWLGWDRTVLGLPLELAEPPAAPPTPLPD